MYKEVCFCPVVKKLWLSEDICEITVKNDALAKEAKCGQFIHIKCGDGQLLRRPISICDTNGDKLRFVFGIRGEGTRYLSLVKEGDELDILGPLGRGFTTDGIKNALLIGGGIGIFPLLMTAKSVNNADIAIGFKSKSEVVLEDDFSAVCRNVAVTTDDASYGVGGLVTEQARILLDKNKYDIIYACGPTPMLKGVVALSNEYNIPCEISLEQRMGCGIGACKVCACKVKAEKKDDFRYAHVCCEGPVFPAQEVIFDD